MLYHFKYNINVLLNLFCQFWNDRFSVHVVSLSASELFLDEQHTKFLGLKVQITIAMRGKYFVIIIIALNMTQGLNYAYLI